MCRAGCFELDNLCRSLSLEKTDSPSLNSHWLPVALCLGVGSCRISPVWVGMSTNPGFVQETILLRIHGQIFSHMSRGHYLESWYPGPLTLTILLPSLCDLFFWAFSVGVCCICIGWGWEPHGHLFSALWPLIGLCNCLRLLWEVSLMRIENYILNIRISI